MKDFVIGTCILMLIAGSAIADEKERFIRVIAELSPDGIRVVKATVHEGKAITRRTPVSERTDPFVLRVYSGTEKLLYQDSFLDPREIHYDYLDEDGSLKGGSVELKSAPFTFTIPYVRDMERIDFFERILEAAEEEDLRLIEERRIGVVKMKEVLQ
jgi:hypothetical protein